MSNRKMIAGALATAMILVVSLPVCTRLETVRRLGFCMPSATFVASLLGMPCLAEPSSGGYMIPIMPMPIHVVLECSAIRYFCITVAILVGLCVERRRIGMVLFMLPLAYVVTLVANTARIICGWQAQCLAVNIMPAKNLGAVHMSVGAACFIIFLIIVYSLMERSLSHEHSEIVA